MNHNDFHGEVRNFIQAGTVVQQAPRPEPPWELCFKPYEWTDRSDKLEQLANWLAADEPRPVQITGPSGSGKTAIAGVAAAMLKDAYPDGVLHLQPSTPGGHDELVSALERLGRNQIPSTPAAVEKVYRSMLASKRMIVVLDGPADREEIERFWPRTATVAFIVLTTAHPHWRPARRLELGPLETEHAADLLEAAVGLGPDVTASLIKAFGGIPGRLLDAGGVIAAGAVEIEDLVALAARHDDAALFLRAYESVSAAAHRVYRALSLLPQPVVEQSLLDWFDANADGCRPSEELQERRLLVENGPGRWRLRLRPRGRHTRESA
ncbi:NB-ARC domain-containing protein [Glycomyces sp. NRRL B-16210]|uniref:NB-ARC domain-containing protein n=1 Tax=Glycomyces sp. NRRL B-16210 TaxID=1463821 RepID=UPI0004C0333C|nr:NB-ARC domain-containing protein [Glycomyces sp. NRRL B-16210]